MIENDRRANAREPWGFVVFRDSFMSGWGKAEGGRSFYALAVDSEAEADLVLENGSRRDEMHDGTIVRTFADLQGYGEDNDHLSIADKDHASAWYKPGAFSDDE